MTSTAITGASASDLQSLLRDRLQAKTSFVELIPEERVETERFATKADVDAGRLFRYIHIVVQPTMVSLTASGTFKGEHSRWSVGEVTLLSISKRQLGVPLFQSFSLGHWTGDIFDYAENFEEIKAKAFQFARDRQQIQANELRNYALQLEEQAIIYQVKD